MIRALLILGLILFSGRLELMGGYAPIPGMQWDIRAVRPPPAMWWMGAEVIIWRF